LLDIINAIRDDTAVTRRILEGTNGNAGLKTQVRLNETLIRQHLDDTKQAIQARTRAFWTAVAALSVSIITLVVALLGSAALAVWSVIQ